MRPRLSSSAFPRRSTIPGIVEQNFDYMTDESYDLLWYKHHTLIFIVLNILYSEGYHEVLFFVTPSVLGIIIINIIPLCNTKKRAQQ